MERDGDGKDHRIDPGDDDFLISGSADIQDLKFDEEFKKKINPDLIEDERIEFEDINSIQTNDFYLKLKDMHDSIKYNVPILIINSDNTFKTKSVEIVSQKLKLELIKVDMSKEITVKDLIARYSEKEDSWPGISMEDGPLLRAFRDGKILLLNEIDKAQPSVLHFLEIALDNEFLNVDLPHQLSERKNKDFRLIISLNVDSYRSILGQEQFYRRFKVIQNFSEDNVEKTCLFYADKYNYENKEIVQKLIEFHATLQSEFGKEKFTYRDILYTLRALSKGENVCETILTNYGARFYEEGEKRKFNEIFDKFPEFNEKTDEDELPKFQNCYFNDSLKSALNSLTLLLQNKQNVLIVGEKGCGKTQLALWSSEDYNKVLRKKDGLHDHEETPLLFMCTQNSKITDLIGGNSSMKKSKNNDIEFWQKGFLPIHIKQGSCCVLDSIDQSPSLILRLSGLLDNEETFEIPESSSCPRLTIHKNFRIIATCNKDNLKSLDQNILNKFTIIFLDNQIKDISENNFKEMIKIMIKKYKFNLSRKITNLRKHGKTGDEGDMKDILIFKKADDAPKDEDDMKDEEYPMNAFYERLKNKNISFISRICKAFVNLSSILKSDDINDQLIMEFAFNLFSDDTSFDIPLEIEEKLYGLLRPIEYENMHSFFYYELTELKKFFAKLMAYSIIEQPICIRGQAGIGKKSALRTFSLMRPNSNTNNLTYQSYSFNNKTVCSDFFGTSTFYQGEIQFNDGPLITSLKKGLVCIADDLNLANEKVIDSLSIVLDSTINRDVFIPNNNQVIPASPDFFFAACINDKEKTIPGRINDHFVYINYPQIVEKEICIEILKHSLSDVEDHDNNEIESFAGDIANHMMMISLSYDDIKKLFKRISNFDEFKYYHLLFYTAFTNNIKNINECVQMMKRIFGEKLNGEDLIECFNDTPKIKNEDYKGYCIAKKDFAVTNYNFIDVEDGVDTLLNTLFQLSLLDKTESALIISNSEFNTFIGYQFLSIVKILSNQGNFWYLTLNEARLLYNKYIIKILDQITNNKDEITYDLDEGQELFPSFYYAMDNLSKILFNNNIDEKIISNFIIEFNQSVFKHIIKSFGIPTSILDDFREDEDDIDDGGNPNNIYRIFATCTSDSIKSLPKEIKSFFTFVFIPEYKPEEQEKILSKAIDEGINIQEELIPTLIKFSTEYESKFNKCFTLSQKLRVIELSYSINQALDNEELKQTSLGIILYRYLGGLMDSKEQRAKLIDMLKIFQLPEIYSQINQHEHIKDKNLFVLDTEERKLKSKMSNLFLYSFTEKETIDKLNERTALTSSFNDLLDLIHMCLTIHAPLLLKGSAGQGKHTAIRYLANILDYEIIPITISSSTTVEDLFGSNTSHQRDDESNETAFTKLIKNSGIDGKKILIVIEIMNNASYEVLNSLIPIFNNSDIIPNIENIERGEFNIIGIFNESELPQSLINSSICYTVLNPDNKEIFEIAKTKLSSTMTLELDEIKNINNMTLNDIENYSSFIKESDEVLDEATIKQIILAYKSAENLESIKFNPLFNYQLSKLVIQMDKEHLDDAAIFIPANPSKPSIISKVNTLTSNQKHALVFLILSYLTKRTCVIQGPKSSGKTHIVNLFSQLLGTNLITFQMNNETNHSLFEGRSILNDGFSEKNEKDINEALKILFSEKIIKDYIKDPKNYLIPQKIRSLLNFIKTIEPELKEKDKWEKINEAIQSIKEIMNPFNRLQRQRSEFINALQNGDWVLIDGIESAPSEIAEFISSLCGEYPEISYYGFGSEYHFSTHSENKIHDDFRLFITYDNYSEKSNNIDKTFLMKSAVFPLLPIEEKAESSAQILFGELTNYGYSDNFAEELSFHLATINGFIKSPFILTYEMNIFNSFREEDNIDRITKSICESIHLFHCDTFTNIEDIFKPTKSEDINLLFNERIDTFKNSKIKFPNHLRSSYINNNIKNKKILKLLRRIISYTNKEIESPNVTFEKLFNKFYKIKISEIPDVQKCLNDTIEFMKRKSKSETKPMIKYGLLCSINSIFNNILKQESFNIKDTVDLSLNNTNLKEDNKIKPQLLRLDLISELLQSNFLIEECSSILHDEDKYEIISAITSIVQRQDKESVADLFKLINDKGNDKEYITTIDKLFPYAYFRDSDLVLIRYWIPLTKTLINQDRINFTIIIDDQNFEFKSSSDEVQIILILKEENNFSYSIGSKIIYMKNKDKIENEFYKGHDIVIYYKILELSKSLSSGVKADLGIIVENIFKGHTYTTKIDNNYNRILDSKILSIRDLFGSNNFTLICMIWNIILTVPEEEINNLSEIINPVEKQMLLTALNMYNSISQEHIDLIISWSDWTESLDDFISPISKCYFDIVDFDKDNNDIFENLVISSEEGLNLIKESPDNEKFWKPNDLIDACKPGLKRLKKLKKEKDRLEKERMIRKKLNDVKNHLNNSRIDPKYIRMKEKILKLINNITEYKEEVYDHVVKSEDLFVREAIRGILKPENKAIEWPLMNHLTIPKGANPDEDEIVKILDILILYSKVREPILDMELHNNFISNIRQLTEYSIMDNPSNILITNLIQNYDKTDSYGITSDDISNAKYTLDAYILLQLYTIKKEIISDKDYIKNKIDKLFERNYSYIRLIEWIYKKINELPSDFLISIPEFSPNSLIFLMVNNNVEKGYQAGPLLKQIKELDPNFLSEMASLMYNEYKTFCEAAKDIAQKTYLILIEGESEDLEDDYNKMKKLLMDKLQTNEKNKKISENINTIFDLAESIDKWTQTKFRIDDLFFLSEEFDSIFNKIENVKSYPTMINWFIKYEYCSRQLKYYFQNYKPKPNEIPFWVICFRVFSSHNCINFHHPTPKIFYPPTSRYSPYSPYSPYPSYTPYVPLSPPIIKDDEKFVDLEYLQFIVKEIQKCHRNDEFGLRFVEKDFTIQNDLLTTGQNNFPAVKNLINHVQYLIACLFINMSKKNCPFSTISCNLLIDCSKHIIIERKIYNFMILISFSYALYYLEIPFTISVVADENFNYTLKTFDEELSEKALQRVLDCLFINTRERCNIACTYKQTLSKFKVNEKSQRAIFLLSDGLCENLVQTKEWKNKLLIHSNVSFGLIFDKFKVYEKHEFTPITKMWDKFINSVGKTSKTKTELTYIYQDFSEKTINSIIHIFVNVLTNVKSFRNKIVDPNPIFVSKYYYKYKELTSESYKKFKQNISTNLMTGNQPIFIKKNAFDKLKGTNFELDDINIDQSKINDLSSSIDKSIEQDFYNCISKNFINRGIAKGTNLIKLLNKSKKARCSVTIIIDVSMSCFNDIAAPHSCQTVQELLSNLILLDNLQLDIIITTNDAPIILCMNEVKEKISNPKSSLWIALVRFLSNNIPFPNKLSPAIRAAFNINKSKTDCSKNLFILTDGLYTNEQKEIIRKHAAACEQNGISVYGVGISLYPIGIEDLFPRVIFCPYPSKLIQEMLSFDRPHPNKEPLQIINENKDFREDTIKAVFDSLKANRPVFTGLKYNLENVPLIKPK